MEDFKGPTIGVLAPYLAGSFYGALISAVHRAVSATGGRVMAISTATLGPDFRRSVTARDQLPRIGWDRASGFVTIAKCVPLSYLEALRDAGKPVVALSHHEPGFACPAVLVDNRGGVTQAVEHLLEHGHERIAFAGSLEEFDVQERYAAYRDTLEAHGLKADPGWFFEASDNLEPGGRAAAERMLAAGLPCSAVVAGNDLNAIGMMSVLKHAGYRVPHDLAVVGFDDSPGVSALSPSLSSVSQRYETMGSLAGRLVLSLVEGEAVEPGPRMTEAAFIARESCGCFAGSVSSGPPGRGGPGNDGDPVSQFVEVLREALSAGGAAGTGAVKPDVQKGEVARLARVIEAAFQRAAVRELAAGELFDLGQACQDLYALGGGPPASDAILAFARQLSARLSQQGGPEAAGQLGTVLRLDQCVAEVRLALSTAFLGARNDAFYQLRDTVRDEHQISLDLLRYETDPQALSWLSRTNAIAAVLGLWRSAWHRLATAGEAVMELQGAQTEGEAPELVVTNTFDRNGAGLGVSAGHTTIEGFPPAELFDRAGSENLVLVFPVRNGANYWGLLSVVVPIDSGLLNQETLFQWEALLCAALDYREVVRALRDMAQVVIKSEERYALAAQAANDGLWDWDLTTGTMYYSARWKGMLGYHSPSTVGDRPEEWLDLVHPDDRPGLMAAVDELRQGQRTTLLNEHRVRSAGGDFRWVLCRGVAVPGRGAPATRIVGSLTDITERRSLEERLRHQALHDDLTGLPNRALFLDRLSLAMATARRRRKYSYAVLWLDLDGFKVLNDSLGHFFGDKLLVQVAERVRSHVRETDTAARFGGDEFALLLQDAGGLVAIEAMARRLLEHLNEPYSLEGQRVVVTASLGIAIGGTGSAAATGYKRPEDVLRDADIAMYKAKAFGPGTFATFDSSMYASAMARMKTETELRLAIEAGQLELHYQPIVDLATGEIMALESLVRWRHPGSGLMAPLQFLPVAEESGLIVAVGHWVQTEACRQLAAWQFGDTIGPRARVGVNVSNREFWDPRLIEHIDQALASHGVRPGCLAIEITEGVIMDNLGRALEVLNELHLRGIQISVDDFGTGYSSLQALHRLPIDSLKIDQSFVAGLGSSLRASELVRTIIQMGRNLGVRVIAEGVETTAQKQALAGLSCPWGQGYLFCRPLPAPDLTTVLGSKRVGSGSQPPADWRGAEGREWPRPRQSRRARHVGPSQSE